MNASEVKKLESFAYEARKNALYCMATLGVGHIGGAMSIIEVLAYLYNVEMNIEPDNPKKDDRDMLVLSKGHAGPGLYATLALKGFFPMDWLKTLNQGGTNLPSHTDRNRTPGIDMSTGSLGQGLSVCAGAAYANKLKGYKSRMFCIMGDGESVEGQIWEAAAFAAQYKLDNLIAITDCNKLQIDGPVDDIVSLGDIEGKWKSFGWDVVRADGHDFKEIEKAFKAVDKMKGKPKMIILDTIKGKGVPNLEGKVDSHNAKITVDEVKNIFNGEVVEWLN